jgi:hypothetical protein
MLGTIAAIKGAIDTVLAHDLDGGTRDGLLKMALRRLEFLTEEVRDLAMGLPDEVIHLLGDIRRQDAANDGAAATADDRRG